MSNLKDKSNVLDYRVVLEGTPYKDTLKVTLRDTSSKGTGLFATKPIYHGETIVFYRLKVYATRNYVSKTKGIYACTVYTKQGDPIKHLVGDLYPGSTPAPLNGIPYWGYFVNEPDINESCNAELITNTKYNYRNRCKLKANNIVLYELKATKYIHPGEEILWHYGPNYPRTYVTSKL